MFLKIATMIAIAGVALSFFLSLFQQVMSASASRFYGDGYLMLIRLIGMMDLLLLYGSLLVFFVAFLMSLKAKAS